MNVGEQIISMSICCPISSISKSLRSTTTGPLLLGTFGQIEGTNVSISVNLICSNIFVIPNAGSYILK